VYRHLTNPQDLLPDQQHRYRVFAFLYAVKRLETLNKTAVFVVQVGKYPELHPYNPKRHISAHPDDFQPEIKCEDHHQHVPNPDFQPYGPLVVLLYLDDLEHQHYRAEIHPELRPLPHNYVETVKGELLLVDLNQSVGPALGLGLFGFRVLLGF